MKKSIVALTLAASLGLASCNAPSVTLATNSLSSVGKIISSSWNMLTADAAPTACAVAQSVSYYGQLAVAAGQLIGANNNVVNTDLAAVNAIGNGSLCTSLLNGGTISNPLSLISQIGEMIANVENATNGKVTAAVATAPTVSNTLGAGRLGMKMASFNDKLRFKLNGLKSTRYHY